MARKKQNPQQEQQPQEAQQEELQRLMSLPLSQINLLPQEKKELVWHELSRQIISMPDFEAGMKAMEAMQTLADKVR